MEFTQASNLINTEIKSLTESGVSALAGALITYLYYGSGYRISLYGVPLEPYLLVGIVVFVSEMLQNQVSMLMDKIGVDNKIKGLNDLAGPVYTGIGAALIIFLNRWYTTGSISMSSVYMPFIIGLVASLVGSKFNKAMNPVIDDLV